MWKEPVKCSASCDRMAVQSHDDDDDEKNSLPALLKEQ